MTRIIVEKVRERTTQPFVIETKPGGNTVIGVKALLATPPDGYTLMLTSSATFHTAPLIVKDAGFDPIGRHLAPRRFAKGLGPWGKCRHLFAMRGGKGKRGGPGHHGMGWR